MLSISKPPTVFITSTVGAANSRVVSVAAAGWIKELG
jgi:hypothetical protein